MPPRDRAAASPENSSGVTVITITDGTKKYELRSDELGPADDLVSRQQTGYPVAHFLEKFSSDSMVVVIWMARRKSGEPNLLFQSVLNQFPTYADLNALDAQVEYDDGEDEDESPLPEDG